MKNNGDGTYDLQVNYRNGTFVTVAGTSPGACEATGTNRKTVGAGITGRVTGHWVATVSAPAGVANRKPDCSGTNCLKASEFLNAVFGSNHWTYSVPFVWLRGKYTTKNNGSWFDTTVNWPFNDQGDITGTL